MRVLTVALVALALTAAPVHADDMGPVVIAKAVASDIVRVFVSIDGPDAGTILPLCDSHTLDPEPNGTAMVGTITGGCFLPLGAECEAVIVGINPNTMPPEVAAGPNWMCIDDTLEDLLGQFGARVPLLIHLDV